MRPTPQWQVTRHKTALTVNASCSACMQGVGQRPPPLAPPRARAHALLFLLEYINSFAQKEEE